MNATPRSARGASLPIHALLLLCAALPTAPLTAAEADKDWLPFSPDQDPFKKDAALDLRSLNEKEAGEGGFIQAKGSQFVHGKTGEPISFWAINGHSGVPPGFIPAFDPGESPAAGPPTAGGILDLLRDVPRLHGHLDGLPLPPVHKSPKEPDRRGGWRAVTLKTASIRGRARTPPGAGA